MPFTVKPEQPGQDAAIVRLLDHAFGKSRQSKTVYRLRQDGGLDPRHCWQANDRQGRLVGSLRFWCVEAGGAPGLLLGPLAVRRRLRGAGIGRALIRAGLAGAEAAGEKLVFVVGEPPYYAAFGFEAAEPLGFRLPGPVDAARFQVLGINGTPPPRAQPTTLAPRPALVISPPAARQRATA